MNGWGLERPTLHSSVNTAAEQVSDLTSLFVTPGGAMSPEFGEKCVDLLAESTGFDGVVMEAVSGLLTDQLTNRVTGALEQYATAINSTMEAENAVAWGDQEQETHLNTGMHNHGGPGAFGSQVK